MWQVEKKAPRSDLLEHAANNADGGRLRTYLSLASRYDKHDMALKLSDGRSRMDLGCSGFAVSKWICFSPRGRNESCFGVI